MNSEYGYDRVLSDTTYEEAVARLRAALADEGFGVLSEIDVAATLAAKLGVQMPRHIILGACNPGLAHRALQTEVQIGLLLPCNAVIREVPGGAEVAIASPLAMFSLVDNPALTPIVSEADERLRRVLAAIEPAGGPP